MKMFCVLVKNSPYSIFLISIRNSFKLFYCAVVHILYLALWRDVVCPAICIIHTEVLLCVPPVWGYCRVQHLLPLIRQHTAPTSIVWSHTHFTAASQWCWHRPADRPGVWHYGPSAFFHFSGCGRDVRGPDGRVCPTRNHYYFSSSQCSRHHRHYQWHPAAVGTGWSGTRADRGWVWYVRTEQNCIWNPSRVSKKWHCAEGRCYSHIVCMYSQFMCAHMSSVAVSCPPIVY